MIFGMEKTYSGWKSNNLLLLIIIRVVYLYLFCSIELKPIGPQKERRAMVRNPENIVRNEKVWMKQIIHIFIGIRLR